RRVLFRSNSDPKRPLPTSPRPSPVARETPATGPQESFASPRSPEKSSNTQDHHFGGLDQRGRHLAFLEAHLTDGIGGHDGRDALLADRECHLGEQPARLDIQNAPDGLVAPADATK